MTEVADLNLASAIELAMASEKEAEAFYRRAADASADPRGKSMFRQLADFENSHYLNLQRLRGQLGGAPFDGYAGTAFLPEKPAAAPVALSDLQIKTDTEAIALAITAEKKAREAYLNLEKQAVSPVVKNMFAKLAAEEELHRKVLEDQFYALSNQGHWIWGE